MKKFVTILLLFIGFLSNAQSADELFKEANTFYKVEDYNRAAGVYLAIEEKGLVSTDLYYNLGNCYYKLNKVAQAIYYYEKALQLDTSNEDTLHNLAFAKRMTLDIIEDLPKTFLQRFSENVIQKYSFDTWALIAVIASFLASMLFLLYHFSGSSKMKLLYFNTTIFTVFVMLVSVFFAFDNYNWVQNNRTAIIFETKTDVKNAPTESSEEIFELHEGTKVIIVDELDNWKKIKIADGKVGWIYQDALKEL